MNNRRFAKLSKKRFEKLKSKQRNLGRGGEHHLRTEPQRRAVERYCGLLYGDDAHQEGEGL